jgi:hypothetical protein
VSRVDQKSGLPPGQFSAPRGIAVDRHGDIYVGEVSWTAWQNDTNPGEPVPGYPSQFTEAGPRPALSRRISARMAPS